MEGMARLDPGDDGCIVDPCLVELRDDWIIVTPRGRLLVRVVCAVFDRYLRTRQARAEYSKVI